MKCFFWEFLVEDFVVVFINMDRNRMRDIIIVFAKVFICLDYLGS